jgi:lipoprotein signal peptidase
MTVRRRVAATGAALVVVALDLTHEVLTPTPFHHPREPGALALMAVLALAVLMVVPRVPSLALAVVGGVAAGGALGNLVSAVVWPAGIPDPIVRGAYAFNLADVAVLVGTAGLLGLALVFAWDNRHRLRAPA